MDHRHESNPPPPFFFYQRAIYYPGGEQGRPGQLQLRHGGRHSGRDGQVGQGSSQLGGRETVKWVTLLVN